MVIHQHILIIRKKHLNSGKDPADGLDHTTKTSDSEYSNNISKSRKKSFIQICITMKATVFLYANVVDN